jgi:PAS domain S-box-containing protein
MIEVMDVKALARLQAEAQKRGCTLEQLVEMMAARIDAEPFALQEMRDELRENAAMQQRILDSQIDLICQYLPDTTLTLVNQAYCNFFGKSREELLGKSFMPLVDTDGHPAILQRLVDCMVDPKARLGEVKITEADGRVRWVEWLDFGITDSQGKVILIQAVGREITASKEEEFRRREQEQLYRLLFEGAPFPMWLYDSETMALLAVNAAALAQYGYTRDEFMTISSLDLQPAGFIERFEMMLSENAGRELRQLPWKHRRKDGSIFDVEITSQPLTLHGRPARFVIAVDTTERVQLDEQRMYAASLELALQKDREIMRVKEKFVSIVSHEFRTPLAVILSSVEILQRYYDKITREKLGEKLEGIAEQVQRMVGLLEDFLTYSRGTAEKLEVRLQLLDLVKLCQSMLDHARVADREQHPFVLEFNLNGRTQFRMDRRLLEHIISNLLSNAAKYSPFGSAITMGVETDDRQLIIWVCDLGIGIPPADQLRLFEPFHRASNVDDIEGTGLGLAIVKQSVDVLGGTIECQSGVGQGTTFTVRLPLPID